MTVNSILSRRARFEDADGNVPFRQLAFGSVVRDEQTRAAPRRRGDLNRSQKFQNS